MPSSQTSRHRRSPPRLRGPVLAGALAACCLFHGPAAAAAEPIPPKVIAHAPLAYPPDGAGREATVHVQVSLDASGAITAARVLAVSPQDAPPSFAEAALQHARALRFSPAVIDGVPAAAQVNLDLHLSPPPSPGPATPKPAPPSASTGTAPAAPPAAAKKDPAPPRDFGTRVRGALRQGERAVSDFNIDPGQLRVVPRRSAGELLTLAPGILLTNEGGEGHAQHVFLRGFDAREGHALEFSVAGVPINEVANAHGQGYADTHFLIPETVSSLRVVEGPFDPRQADFAVAGSAEYRLGVAERGLRVSYRGGSFGSHRLLLLWAPDDAVHPHLSREGTFAAVELAQSDGYGTNRFSQRAAATAQYEGRIGDDGGFTLLFMSYAARFKSPGVLRQDDYEAGRVGFFDSYDLNQGGDAQRHSISGTIWGKAGPVTLHQGAFLVLRDLRLRENFTGFVHDPQQLWQSPHPQRGDLIDQNSAELTVGGRGSATLSATVRGLTQRLHVGYSARYDRNQASQLRLTSPLVYPRSPIVPYRTDFDVAAAQASLGAYLDLEVHPLRWLTLRGGVRGDFFHYQVNNLCDQREPRAAGAPQDLPCYAQDRYGPRLPTARYTATGLIFQPRATLQVEPLRGLFLSGSYGRGARSLDPLYVGDGDDAPFSKIDAVEGGALLHRALGALELTARGAFFYTHVDRDQLFDQVEGRPTLAPGTTRLGVIGAGRLTGPFVDAALSVTWARATFDDTGLLVPYVPEVVVRADAAGFGPLPRLRLGGDPLRLSGGVGFTYVAPRPLPFSERGDAYVLLDVTLRARWKHVEVGVSIENLLDRRYRQSEFNYVSDFQPPGAGYPTRVATRHFIAGPPLVAMATVTLYADGIFRELRRLK